MADVQDEFAPATLDVGVAEGASAPASPAADVPLVGGGAYGHVESVPPPPAPDPGAPPQLLRQILAEIRGLGDDFSLKLKYDHAKEKAVEALSDELRQHRGGLHFNLLRPLLADLIALYDDLCQLADARRSDDGPAARTFDGLAATVEELLARQGVSTFKLAVDAFDTKQQRAVRTVETDQQEMIGAVAARVRVGFRYEDRIVRPEQVALYVLRPPQPATSPKSEE